MPEQRLSGGRRHRVGEGSGEREDTRGAGGYEGSGRVAARSTPPVALRRGSRFPPGGSAPPGLGMRLVEPLREACSEAGRVSGVGQAHLR